MPAINYEEDTEFNEALRKHGIIPEREPTSRSPSPPPFKGASPTLAEQDIDDLLLSTDDALPRSVLENYREQRMKQAGVQERNRRFGRVYPIGKTDYTREVSEGSMIDIEGEEEGEGTGVVCYLFKDYIPGCKLLAPILSQLAGLYPSTKFVSIVSDHCIENYPDKNCPTLLVYRAGKFTGQVVGTGGIGGDNITLGAVERILFAFRALDLHLKVGAKTNAQFTSKNSDQRQKDESESDEDETFVGGGRSKGRGKTGIRSSARREEEDDEFDL